MIVFIPTQNESKHILRAISSARNLSHNIYVVDSQSQDSTIELALSQNVEVIQVPDNMSFAQKMNFIYHNDLFEGEYIFCHHADEIITKKDAELVKKAIEKEIKDATTIQDMYLVYHKRFGINAPFPMLEELGESPDPTYNL